MASVFETHYQDEDAARQHLEAIRWPDGPVCPHCGVIGEAYKLEPKAEGKTHVRKGVYKCAACREQFTVTVGTIFEDSKIPLHKWLLAVHLMCSSKKGIGAHQLMRNLGIGSYRTAWFMAHRIRWALGQEPMASKLSGIVEVDEAYIGGKSRKPWPWRGRMGRPHPRSEKAQVVSLVERNGEVRSHHVQRITGEGIKPIVDEMVERGTHLMTDSASTSQLEKYGWKRSKVDHHKKEYARREDGLVISTNTVEGYFSILKRGINGIYHHVGKAYLDQYLREFDYRYNVRKMDDGDRFRLAVRKTGGKRLAFRAPKSTPQN